MDPQNQNDQDPREQSERGFNPINTLNNLMDIRRGFGKKTATQAGGTVAKSAGKMALKTAGKAILSNPYVLAAIGAAVLVVIVFVIVFSGGAPGAPAIDANPPADQAGVPTATPIPEP